MNRDTIRAHLKAGGTMDGLALTEQGRVVARGKVQWEGTTWSGSEDGKAVELRLQHGGERFYAPLAEAVLVKKGQPVELKFGPKWQ